MVVKNLLYLVVMLGVAACGNQFRSEIVVTIAPTASLTASQSSPLITPLTPEMSSEGISSSPSGRMTLISGLVRHPKLPPYEIWYDASIWQYTEREDEEPGLINRGDPNCYLSLRGEATEATPVAKVVLAGLEWTIYDGKYSTYYSITDPFNYIFRVDLPDPYQLTAKSTCQQLAEDVIDTFRIMD